MVGLAAVAVVAVEVVEVVRLVGKGEEAVSLPPPPPPPPLPRPLSLDFLSGNCMAVVVGVALDPSPPLSVSKAPSLDILSLAANPAIQSSTLFLSRSLLVSSSTPSAPWKVRTRQRIFQRCWASRRRAW